MSSVLETLSIYELTKRRNDLLKQIDKIDKILQKNNSDISPIEEISDMCPNKTFTEETIQPKIIKINIKKITKSENGDVKSIVELENTVIKRIKIKK